VTVLCSIDGGLRSELRSISGDIGENVIGGRSDYMILWDVLSDVSEVNSVDFFIKAELVKDNTPEGLLYPNKALNDISQWKTHILFFVELPPDLPFYGLRIGYSDNIGVSGKLGFSQGYEEFKKQLFSSSLDFTVRIIKKNRYQMHLLTGASFAKLRYTDYNSSLRYFGNFGGANLGLLMSSGRISYSVDLSIFFSFSGKELTETGKGEIGIGLRL